VPERYVLPRLTQLPEVSVDNPGYKMCVASWLHEQQISP